MSQAPSELTITAEHRYLHTVDTWVAEFIARLQGVDIDEQFAQDLVLATHELVANLVDHAYGGHGGCVQMRIWHDTPTASICVQLLDDGHALNTANLPNTTWGDCLDGRELLAVEEPTWDQIRGRGLFLIHSLTNGVRYQIRNGMNCWTLIKKIRDLGVDELHGTEH